MGTISGRDKIAVFSFGNEVYPHFEFTKFSPHDRTAASDMVREMKYRGKDAEEKTNTLAALEYAMDIFDNNPVGVDVLDIRPQLIFLLTDGKPDCDGDCDPCSEENK